jgi:PAS domain S-box-containing protein
LSENKISQKDFSTPSAGAEQALRQKAEEGLEKQSPTHGPGKSEETDSLLHELQVHQIELLMQNEELRRGQAELEDSRAKYFDLYDMAPVGYLTLSEKGLILELNLTMATLLGETRRDLIKQPLSRFILPEDQELYYWHRKQVLATDAPNACELRMKKKTGIPFWVYLEANTARNPDGLQVTRVVINEIASPKPVQEARARLIAIIESTTDAIATFDLDMKLLYLNKAGRAMVGLEEDEDISGRNAVEFISEGIKSLIFKVVIPMCVLQGHWKGETSIQTLDGREIPVSIVALVHKTPDGRVQYFSTIIREIAELKRVEDELRQSQEMLRKLASRTLSAQEDERKRIALEVHDALGSSLSAIKFKVEEVLLRLHEEGTSNVAISKSLEPLIPFIQDTIEETRRIQTELRPPILDDLGIVATLSWLCRRFKAIYSHIHVEQTVTIQDEEVPDHLKLSLFRIAQEAMNNISKHAKAESVCFGLQKVDDVIELCIRDNGAGFDPESLSLREISKKGLGLSSMKERVEFSGGSFSIESALGKGTVIKALWPR